MNLVLSEAEWTDLQAASERNYVLTIKADILRARPDLADDATLTARLDSAYDKARAWGIKNDPHVEQFLWLEAMQPGFYKQYAVSTWLTAKGGYPPDERFEILIGAARHDISEKERH